MKLSRVINFLTSRPRSVFRRRRSSATTSSYMDSIPDELLLDIFQIIADDRTGTPTATAILSHVCSRWRGIILSSGSLWADIYLTFPITARQLAYVMAYLGRSGSHPLDIYLDFRDPAWDWNEDTHPFRWQEMEPVMRLFLVHVARWRSLELLTDTWSPIFTFLWYTQQVTAAPVLETLSLSRCNLYFAGPGLDFEPAALRQPARFFGGIVLPRLRAVALTGVHIDWDQPSLRNLTELDLKYLAHDVMPTLSQFEAIISACPRLTRLALFGWGPIMDNTDHTAPAAPGRVRLPSLQRLSFGFLYVPYAVRVLALFDAPVLTELVLEDISRVVTPGEVQEDATPLLQWLSSSSPHQLSSAIRVHQLGILEMHNVLCDNPTFAAFLRPMASLRSLGMYDIADDMLQALISNGLETLCPQLEELHCQDMDPDSILTVVTSRRLVGHISPLSKVVLEFVRQAPPPQDSSLHRRLVGAGVEIQWRSDGDSSDSQNS